MKRKLDTPRTDNFVSDDLLQRIETVLAMAEAMAATISTYATPLLVEIRQSLDAAKDKP